ncbi:broad-complex core protein isoforms 1/2/3/4/5 isoform X3 [Condylostylus longicornis]|uniref:broad-complex core protein isoforms 1/2/3/4/5 isoform X3 n=1 Tax=Condylostylus longicornis TaxID=2530218 RepID=UPI00244E1807|nr:broad-complex core protein isoforms 1/2/3/4/5 isoform X3 [Condylostylus longicornis]
MVDTQHFCLRWNNYQSSITSAFENLRDDEDFVDVTLACDGRSIKAHRVVLSACSPYFRELLKSTPCKHPVIVLQDVSYPDLHALVEFIYHGEVNVHQSSLSSFLKTAEVLRVSGLTQRQAEETQNLEPNLTNSGGIGSGNGNGISGGVGSVGNVDSGRSSVGGNVGGVSGVGSGLVNSSQNNRDGCNSIGGIGGIDNNIGRRSDIGNREIDNITPRTPINHRHPFSDKISHPDDSPLFPNCGVSPPAHPLANMHHSPLTNVNQLLRRAAVAALHRDRHNSSQSENEIMGSSGQKRHRSSNDNGISSSNNNSPDPTTRDQITAADYSTIKHNNNNTPPIKDDKSEINDGNGPTGNGITSNDKDSLSHSPPPTRLNNDDVKSEPMELVCSNNNPIQDEHSNDSTGEHDANRSSSGDIGKGSLSSANDDEMENSIHSHHQPPFLNESKFFATPASFNFPMATLDPATLAGFNSHLQSAAEAAISPQGSQNAITGQVSSSTPPMNPSPTNCYSPLGSPPGSAGSTTNDHKISGSGINCNSSNGGRSQSTSPVNNGSSNGGGQILRMPPPTSGGINEPQECPYCRRTFSCYYSLKRHFQDKHEQSDTLYVCEFCHRRYRTKNSLTTHKSLQHRGTSGMLKRLLKTSAIKNVLGGHHHHHHHHHQQHHHSLSGGTGGNGNNNGGGGGGIGGSINTGSNNNGGNGGLHTRPSHHLFNFANELNSIGPVAGSNYPGDLEFGKALTSSLIGSLNNVSSSGSHPLLLGEYGTINNGKNSNNNINNNNNNNNNNKSTSDLVNDWSNSAGILAAGSDNSPISIIKQQIQ